MPEPVYLSARGVTFRYFEGTGPRVLEGAELSVPAGEIAVITGKSGCGKSTLAAVCAGLYPENAGELLAGRVQAAGRDVGELAHARRAGLLTMMFQNADLQFCMDTLRGELIFCLENIAAPRDKMDETVARFARELHVTSLLDRRLSTLSGGEKQKAALCCLFLIGSRCILLDEPFANLDEDSARELIGMLDRRRRETGLTVVAVDHRLDYWLPAADEILILGEGGRLLGRTTPENLPACRALFAREGLCYPEPAPAFHPVPAGESGLTLENLSLPRGRTGELLLQSAAARFGAGQVTALLGHSGCGKTTLFSAILRQADYRGSIRLGGREVKKIPRRELYRRVGAVFQNPADQFLTTGVEEEIEKSLAVWQPGLTPEARAAAARRLLAQFRLDGHGARSPYMLSQGQQRRLAVLSVIAGGQKILLMDEPTYGQDGASARAILELTRRLARERGLTVIFATHDRPLACRTADRIYEMKGGRLIEWNGSTPSSNASPF